MAEQPAELPRDLHGDNPKTHPTSNAEKDPHDWVTGGEPMTGAQASYLKTLSERRMIRRRSTRTSARPTRASRSTS
jgi:hypothetical protein